MSNKELLLGQKPKYVKYEADGLGTVDIRVLSRAECLELRDIAQAVNSDGAIDEQAALAFERQLLAKCLEVSEDDVVAWYEVATVDQVNNLMVKVSEVNGLGEQSAKTAYKSPGKQSRTAK